MTFTAGQKLRASDLNGLPYTATLGAQVRTTNTLTTSGTTEAVCATTPTITLLANTWYQIYAQMLYSGTTAADQYEFRIRDTNLSGTQRNAIIGQSILGAGGGPYTGICPYVFKTGSSPSPLNWVCTVARVVGSGTATIGVGSIITVEQFPSTATVNTV